MTAPTVSVEAALDELGPSLSSRVSEHLQKAGVSAAAARQRISRAQAPVARLELEFPHRERFLFLEDQKHSPSYWEALLEAFDKTGSVFGLAAKALEVREGLLPVGLFGTMSGSPNRLRKHLSHDVVLKRAVDIGLFARANVPGLGECIQFGPRLGRRPLAPLQVRARLLTEAVALDAVHQWVRRLGLGSHDSIRIRPNLGQLAAYPAFGAYNWDLTGPSYVLPLATYGKGELAPGFVVADIHLGVELEEDAVRPFLAKCDTMRHLRKTRPFLAFLIADRFSKAAFKLRSDHGVILTTPDILFGEDVARALRTLLATLTAAADAAVASPEAVADLLEKLGRIEGAAANLRGPLFEHLVAHCVHSREGGTIKFAVDAHDPSTGQRADIDVLRAKESVEVAVYECKGKLASIEVSLAEVEHWVKSRIPVVNAWLDSQPHLRAGKRRFEFWTTGAFSKDAREFLEQAKRNTRRYDIAFQDHHEVLDYASRVGSGAAIVKTLQEHFLKHPLAKLPARSPDAGG